MCIVDCKYVNISSFAVLDIKLWLEEGGCLRTDNSLYSFEFIPSRGLKDDKNAVFSYLRLFTSLFIKCIRNNSF